MPVIDPGILNRRIRIRLWADAPNAAFGLDPVYDAGIARWARHEPVHSITLRAGMATGDAPTDLFWVRYATGTKPTDITASHVIDFAARRYRVVDVIDVDDQNKFSRISTIHLGPTT